MESAASVLYSPGIACRRDGVITIGATWWNGLFVMASVGAGLAFIAPMFVAGRDRPTCAAHAAMCLAMAGMFWPSGDPAPAAAGAVLFALIGAWFGAGWLRGGAVRLDGAAHLVIGSAAMVLMYLGHGRVAPGDGHALHGGATAAGGPGMLLAGAGLLFTGYFLWHAWERLARPPAPVAAAGAVLLTERVALRTEPAAHVAMSLLMSLMFLGTI